MENEDVNQPELIEKEKGTALAVTHPSVPVTVDDLAAHIQGKDIIERRALIIDTLRTASLKLIMPTDIVLNKMPDGNIIGFLQDSGCDRVKKLWGIQIQNLGVMTEAKDADSGEFAYRITGDGFCNVTGEWVYDMEGVRYSTERYAQQKDPGIQRIVAVQKAARANLDGGITRELTGLKQIPFQELEVAWAGSWKKWEMCTRGHGFGTGNERVGGADEKAAVAAADVPVCPICKIKLVYRPAKKFWGCPQYSKHPTGSKSVIIDHEQLLKEIASRAGQTNMGPDGKPLEREPGSEG